MTVNICLSHELSIGDFPMRSIDLLTPRVGTLVAGYHVGVEGSPFTFLISFIGSPGNAGDMELFFSLRTVAARFFDTHQFCISMTNTSSCPLRASFLQSNLQMEKNIILIQLSLIRGHWS